MYILAGLLLLGFLCNLMVRPVDRRNVMSAEQLAYERRLAHERSLEPSASSWAGTAGPAHSALPVVLAWGAVGLPLAWGVWVTVQKAALLFH